MLILNVQNLDHPLQTPLRVRYCQGFWCHLRGLMFHPPLDIDEGLLLVYKKENRIDTVIHMFFMRMDLTVVWVNEINEVVDVRLAKRWRPAYTPKKPAKFVLELSEEHISSFQVGDRLSFKNPESRFSFEG